MAPPAIPGAGGVAHQVIGTVIIVGMAFATAIAVFVVPVLFVVVERVSHRARRRPSEAGTSAGPVQCRTGTVA